MEKHRERENVYEKGRLRVIQCWWLQAKAIRDKNGKIMRKKIESGSAVQVGREFCFL
jgi:hypothetical protein